MKNKEGEKQHEHHNDKINVCSPDGIFCVKTKCVLHNWTNRERPGYITKRYQKYTVFFMTSYATIFYRGKGEFTAFTLNTKGVVSLIMLIMPIVLDFVFMWIHRKECE